MLSDYHPKHLARRINRHSNPISKMGEVNPNDRAPSARSTLTKSPLSTISAYIAARLEKDVRQLCGVKVNRTR